MPPLPFAPNLSRHPAQPHGCVQHALDCHEPLHVLALSPPPSTPWRPPSPPPSQPSRPSFSTALAAFAASFSAALIAFSASFAAAFASLSACFSAARSTFSARLITAVSLIQIGQWYGKHAKYDPSAKKEPFRPVVKFRNLDEAVLKAAQSGRKDDDEALAEAHAAANSSFTFKIDQDINLAAPALLDLVATGPANVPIKSNQPEAAPSSGHRRGA
ncbi:hypothetical protein B0H14DRAFT_3489693 [Mycena olivaceomarginata]|nr:hypothetical protein B0H14DRAFT_3524613 [Mycena olivaceomarginata]KAJ7801366.1 hypothetical protein B0H14DRAFT_3489693 [Mycena olivaceomarginata]